MASTVILITFLFAKFFPSLATVSTIMTIGTFCRVKNGKWYQIHWGRSLALGCLAAVIFYINVPLVSIFLGIGQIAGLLIRTRNKNKNTWREIVLMFGAAFVVFIVSEQSWSFMGSAQVFSSSLKTLNDIIVTIESRLPFPSDVLVLPAVISYVGSLILLVWQPNRNVSQRINEVINGLVFLVAGVILAGGPFYLYGSQLFTWPLCLLLLLVVLGICLLLAGIASIWGTIDPHL